MATTTATASPLVTRELATTPTPLAEDAFLARQALALQPAFQGDLAGLTNAPRYTIDAAIDLQNSKVEGRLTLGYTNTTGRPLSELAFRLFPNARTIYGGGSLSVDRVVRGDTPVEFELSVDRTVMRVPLEPRLAAGDAASISMTFAAQVPVETQQGYGIFNQARGVTSLAGWYPILAVYRDGWQTPAIPRVGDAMWAETSLYEVILIVPAGVAVVSTGTVVEVETGGKNATWRIVSGPARDFAVAVGNQFQQQQTQVGDATVNYYALPVAQPKPRPEGLQPEGTSAETTLAMVADAFTAYARRFGPYPFREFDVVEAAIPIGGYEFTGMVYVDYGLRIGGNAAHLRYIVGHEVAHQWWYGLVGNDPVNEPWLDEALASYAATIYLEEVEGEAAARDLIASWERTYGRPATGAPSVTSPARMFSGWPAYRSATYYHGALFLDALRQEIGDERFFKLLQSHLVRYRYQITTTADFLSLAEEVAGRDLDPLLQQLSIIRPIEAEPTAVRGGPDIAGRVQR